jgi:uncharacterized protein DUF4434
MSKPQRTICLLLMLVATPLLSIASPSTTLIKVSLNTSRAQPGQKIEVKVALLTDRRSAEDIVKAVVLTPTAGAASLSLTPLVDQPGVYRGEISLDKDAAEGLYVVHAWLGEMKNPTAVAKAHFLLGQLINDFFIASYVDKTQPALDVDAYLKEFRAIGGNFLIAHNLIISTGAFYPSKIAKTDVLNGSKDDLVELILDRADQQGIAVLLSVSWDMTKQSAYGDRIAEIKAIATEMFFLYRHHPSLAGFYSYQEGSGTYYAPYVREFSAYIKSLDSNLLTACAPHVDDPLLAGYLSTIDDLDIIIYQAGVMASYRTDNRKQYPFRRVKDFCGLGAGAKRLQNKISINHVELFGYLEKRLNPETTATTYENIYQQILSAATVAGADGISFFTYHAHVYEARKKQPLVERSRMAVADGMKAFKLVSSKISQAPNAIAIYFPYSDWIIERWPNYFLPALDGFRILGIPADVLPYAPPLEESVYPYYPFHMNLKVLERLLREQTVLVLPNVSGFQQTDSDLIKAFIEQGGVIVAFGPQIPMGRSYERKEVFGGDEERDVQTQRLVIVREAIGKRAKKGTRFNLSGAELTRWSATTARVIATFADGAPAITVNKYGKGLVATILVDAQTAAQTMPELVRDLLDYATSFRGNTPTVDIVGTNENTDMAVSRTATGFRVAVINHNGRELEVQLRPQSLSKRHKWIDIADNRELEESNATRPLDLRIPSGGFRAIEFRRIP